MISKNNKKVNNSFYEEIESQHRDKLESELKTREREKLRKILKKESFLCREESLKVCREFDALPDPIPGLD